MKKFCILPLVAALAFFVSCQKQQSEEEKKAEVERQVQERLAAERQADEKQRLAQQQADLEAREKALAAKEAVVSTTTTLRADPVAAETPLEAPATAEETDITSEARSSASYGTFYRKLEPYGAWRETNEYGYVWQPREAEERNWRPYTDGRWVYTDAGWTWISEEPFGWATYHYGRWVRLRRVGWVWVPGQQWAPAWVSWRTSKDYVGWAPLPPEARFERKSGIHNWADNYYDIGPDQYAFVPNNEFGSRRVQRSVVPVERNVTIVIETTNVTNITYANTTIINQGPNYEEMRSRSQQPIERYRLERQLNSDTNAPPTVRGEVLVVSAPVITTVPGVDRPQTVKETITEATVEKSWAADTDRPAADRARAKMEAEVVPPTNAPSKAFVRPVLVATSPTPPAANASPVTIPTATASTTSALAPTTRATPKPALPTAAPTARTTPVAISTARPSVLATPTPIPGPRVIPKPLSPAATPMAESTVPAISTPSVLASPSRPRHPVSPPKSSPPDFVKPSASPEMAPAITTPPSTPPRVPLTTPRRIVPTPLDTPATRPSLTPPAEVITKPLPHDRGPRPVVPQPLPVMTPPARSSTDASSAQPNETKPVVRHTPPSVRIEPPGDPVAIPSASTMPSEDRKANNKRPQRSGPVEGEKLTPVPTGSPSPAPK